MEADGKHREGAFRATVLIPSYNTGSELLVRTVQAALDAWPYVRVVIDGSTDASGDALTRQLEGREGLEIQHLENNAGKGAAVRAGAEAAREDGFTHVLTMDADGQHPADHITPLMRTAASAPHALIAGQPVFGPDVPWARLKGRKLTIWWTELETLWCGLGDTLFGMRVYPVDALLAAMASTPHACGYDFDPEIAVRMVWMGVRPIPQPVPVRYLDASEGGVSHFHYIRDNVKLTWLHFRLMPRFLLRVLPRMLRLRREWNRKPLHAS